MNTNPNINALICGAKLTSCQDVDFSDTACLYLDAFIMEKAGLQEFDVIIISLDNPEALDSPGQNPIQTTLRGADANSGSICLGGPLHPLMPVGSQVTLIHALSDLSRSDASHDFSALCEPDMQKNHMIRCVINLDEHNHITDK